MIVKTAKQVKAAGAHFLRGGAYKPRSSPYAFQFDRLVQEMSVIGKAVGRWSQQRTLVSSI